MVGEGEIEMNEYTQIHRTPASIERARLKTLLRQGYTLRGLRECFDISDVLEEVIQEHLRKGGR